jgi:hypothetical protein
MKKPGELHIINGPVFSAYTNRWGADCSYGWKTSHQSYGFVEWAVTQHGRIGAGFSTTKRKRRERRVAPASEETKSCPACAEKSPAHWLWCWVCGFRFDSAEAAPDT